MRGHTSHETGFTLIELMVAMCLIALLSGIAMVSIGGRESGVDELQETAAGLHDLMMAASTRAIMVARPVGMHVLHSDSDDGWEVRWSHWQQGGWHLLTEGMAPIRISSQVHIEIEVEGSQLDLGRERRKPSSEILKTPALVFYQTGEVTPFVMTLQSDSVPADKAVVRAKLSNLDNGEIELDW